ncbi:MLO-like protein 15 [Silene latifolia]|uniref:MLO-like protein 15 n=1 Tax=Silene latifolia TaxID=37657 RepID=UPI003D787DF5
MAGGGGGSSFESTPTWIIGAVVFVIITISWGIERLLKCLETVLKRKERKPLKQALQTIKEELMLMGFVSLLLALIQDKTKKWCIPEELSLKWLPCHTDSTSGRHLAEDDGTSMCKEGEVPLISIGVLHDLHYLIFMLAVAHALNCTVTVLLGMAKISLWRKWEVSLRKHIDLENRSLKIMETRSLTFIRERFDGVNAKRHYVYSFFKYLGGVVTKADYEAMRMGFILAHCNGNQRFNFQKYVRYAYEADFKEVVSISWFLWVFAVISLSLNVAGWNIYFWFSFIPFLILLVIGTKLEKVITDLATYVAQRHTVIVGEIRLHPSDDYFWFRKPRIMLLAIHAILFMNSFGFAIFFWTLWKFKFDSCIMGNYKFAIARIAIMLVVQFLCNFSFLPLYAIVTQVSHAFQFSDFSNSLLYSNKQTENDVFFVSLKMGSSFNKEGMARYSAAATHSARIPEHTTAAVTVDLETPNEEEK